ncbi:MAG: MCE family protein [Nocardia sp.]|nr:MCE family protein [Nocardia sp.]
MSTLFEPDGRGPSGLRLALTGVCFLLIVTGIATAMVAISRGAFRKTVPIVAVLADVGDGLPPKSDVKFHGVRVGLVTSVGPASRPDLNDVEIQLNSHYAHSIPRTVTARVVPSNVFAVPSIQLVDNGSAPAVSAHGRIEQDRSQSTVRLQTSLDQLRRIIGAVGREGTDTTVGMLATLAQATAGRGKSIEESGAQLRDIVTELNRVVSIRDAPTTLDALSSALRNVRESAPELLDTLHHAVTPMLTLAQQRQQLTDLLTGSQSTLRTVGDAFEHNSDRLIDITTHISPALDTLGDGAAHFPQMSSSIIRMATKFDQAFDPRTQHVTAKAIVQITPNRTFARADCPRYGTLAGASCTTAPLNPPPPAPVPAALAHPKADIGPVGSPQEQQQISRILGGDPNAAADILFGPLARGARVSVTPEPGGGR